MKSPNSFSLFSFSLSNHTWVKCLIDCRLVPYVEKVDITFFFTLKENRQRFIKSQMIALSFTYTSCIIFGDYFLISFFLYLGLLFFSKRMFYIPIFKSFVFSFLLICVLFLFSFISFLRPLCFFDMYYKLYFS